MTDRLTCHKPTTPSIINGVVSFKPHILTLASTLNIPWLPTQPPRPVAAIASNHLG
jgi:hypothetical protein